MLEENERRFFGHYVYYRPREKKEAETYLKSWKKFFMRRLPKELEIEEIDCQKIERPAEMVDNEHSSMAMKIMIKANWHEVSMCNEL